MTLCLCGCKKSAKSGKKYLHGHNGRKRLQAYSVNNGIALIPLGGEVFTKMDAEDAHRFKRKIRLELTGYAAFSEHNNFVHRWVIGARQGQIVDHINGDRLDNRRDNLRIVSPAENTFNRVPDRFSSSDFKGVSWCNERKRWRVSICVAGKNRNLGRFFDEVEAARAYDRAARELHGSHAWLNNA